ncbi:MAG: CoA ester lyase [Desulfobacterales bacterium]
MKPRRSTLSVPGHVAKMHQKASSSAADVIMLDLEDSVPLEEKAAARRQVSQTLNSIDWGSHTVTVRINSTDTPFAYRDMIEVVSAAGSAIDTLVLPKTDHPGDVHFVSRLLDGIEKDMGLSRSIGIEASIESARGLSQVEAIAGASDRLRSLVFGIADYSASVGARLVSLSGHGENETLYPGHRWHYVMSRLVMAAKAHQLLAIDAPYGNFKDPNGLESSAVISCALGFDGKWAIHPDQIDILNRVYEPSPEDLQRAQAVIAAFERARREGRGAAAVEGRMIDHATYRLARQLVSQARFLGLL